MQQTRTDATQMKDDIKKTMEEFEKAKVETYRLLQELTACATVYEKLKAKFGLSGELSDYLGLNEFIEEQPEDEDFLIDGKLYVHFHKLLSNSSSSWCIMHHSMHET